MVCNLHIELNVETLKTDLYREGGPIEDDRYLTAMTHQITDQDDYSSYFVTSAMSAVRNRQPRQNQHVPAQYSQRSRNSHEIEPLSRYSSPFRMLHGEAGPSCHMNDKYQTSFTQDFRSLPNDYHYRDHLTATNRPSSWHANTMQNFCYSTRTPAFSATNEMQNHVNRGYFSQQHDYPDLLFSPVHDHQIYSAPMMSKYDHTTSTMVPHDALATASMQQAPSFAKYLELENFNQDIPSVDLSSQDAKHGPLSQYVPWQMRPQHQLHSFDDSSCHNMAYNSTIPHRAPQDQSQDIIVVQEELIGLGLYDDDSNKIPRSARSMRSPCQPSATADRPAFLLGEGWQPPEPEEDGEDRDYQDNSSASEDLNYLDTPLEPDLQQTQQMQWPIYRSDQKPQPTFTYNQNVQFGVAHYWPMEEMGTMMHTTTHEQTWQDYGWQYSNPMIHNAYEL